MTKSKKMKEDIREVPDDIIQVGLPQQLFITLLYFRMEIVSSKDENIT